MLHLFTTLNEYQTFLQNYDGHYGSIIDKGYSYGSYFVKTEIQIELL